MASGNDRVERWVRKVLSDPVILATDSEKPRKCFALSLMHATGGIRQEVQTLKLGAKQWDTRQVAEMFNGIVDEHSAGLASSESGSGQEQYVLVAFYDDLPEHPQCPLPIMRRTGPMLGSDEHPLTSEPPNGQGMTRQDMRHKESWMQFALDMVARTYAAQSAIIERQNARLQTVERENQDAFQMTKEMILEKVADTHEVRMRELAFVRGTEERQRLMKMAPPLVNRLLGKEVFPQSTVDSSLIEALLEGSDEKQISKIVEVLIPVLKPEQAALLFARFAEIQEAMNERKAKAHASANGNGATKS